MSQKSSSRFRVRALAGWSWLVKGSEQLGHAAVDGDGPGLGERSRGGGKVVGTCTLPQQQRVVAQGVREHGPGAEPPVAADGRAVMPLCRRDVIAERRQACQVEVGGAGAHDRPGRDGSAPGVGGQGLVDAWRVVCRSQEDAAAGEFGQCPQVEHVGAQAFESGGREFVQAAAGLLDGAVGGVDLDQGGGVRHRHVGACHQVT